MERPILKVTFIKPTHGYWDGGAKSGGEFHPQPWNGGTHPGQKPYSQVGMF